MKRLIVLFSFIFVIVLAACGSKSDTTENLQQKFPEYYNLNTAKGLEVYVWQTAEDTYYCGVLPGTNRGKTDEEIFNLATNGATVEEMKVILSSYNIPKSDITIRPCAQPISSYLYEIDDIYIQNIIVLFENNG